MSQRAVSPLTRTTTDGRRLRRPPRVEAEIAAALGRGEAAARAAVSDPGSDGYLSNECMVHLIRRGVRSGRRGWAEELAPHLLRRCEAQLRRAVRGFSGIARDEVVEEVLGRLAVSLVEPGDRADFFEVRFALALKRVRIDVCRQQRRRRRREVALDEVAGGDLETLAPAIDLPPPMTPEQALGLRRALASLSLEERRALVLHRIEGLAINSKVAGHTTLVGLLGVSERTVRNRLRRAEAKLRAFAEVGG